MRIARRLFRVGFIHLINNRHENVVFSSTLFENVWLWLLIEMSHALRWELSFKMKISRQYMATISWSSFQDNELSDNFLSTSHAQNVISHYQFFIFYWEFCSSTIQLLHWMIFFLYHFCTETVKWLQRAQIMHLSEVDVSDSQLSCSRVQ